MILAFVLFPLGFGLCLIGGRFLIGVILWMVFDVTVDTLELEGLSAFADDIQNRSNILNSKNLVFFHVGVDLLLFFRGLDRGFCRSFGWSDFCRLFGWVRVWYHLCEYVKHFVKTCITCKDMVFD